MDAKIRNGKLVIVLQLEQPRQSATGKTLVVASSHGVKKTRSRVDGKIVCVVASAFVYPKAPDKELGTPMKRPRKR